MLLELFIGQINTKLLKTAHTHNNQS